MPINATITYPDQNFLQQALKLWGLSGETRFIRKVENFVYEVIDQNYIIRVTDDYHRKPEQIQAELNWMQHLSKNGIELASPQPSLKEKLVERLPKANKLASVVVFKRVTGKVLKEQSDFTKQVSTNVGSTIANMHTATENFKLTTDRFHWNTDPSYKMSEKFFEKDTSSPVGRAFNKCLAHIDKLAKTPSNYGLVHADVHPGNFFVNDDQNLCLIDFDDSQYHWFAYDLSVPLFSSFMRFNDNNWVFDYNTEQQILLDSYNKARPHHPIEAKDLDLFFRYRLLLLYYWSQARCARGDMQPASLEWAKSYQSWCEDYISTNS